MKKTLTLLTALALLVGCASALAETEIIVFAAAAMTETLTTIAERYSAHMDKIEYVAAKDVVMELVHAANHYIEDSTPWAIAKDPARASELAQVMANLLEAIRICAHLLAPFMPETSAEVLRRLSLEAEADTRDLVGACAWGGLAGGVPVTKGAALFPRLQSSK